jgi:glycosyltransferase involved in cell wall biosynthesis
MKRLNVMQVTDTLDAGGAERIAVTIANLLPRSEYKSYLCTTRRDGPLLELLASDVNFFRLSRRGRFDLFALRRFCHYLAQEEIDILHAHGTSVFISAIASLSSPFPKLVWHDHYGRYRFDDRPVRAYRLAAARVNQVIAVNDPLVEWAIFRLRVATQRVKYIPNFICETETTTTTRSLPGQRGLRVVCVANFRPEKDHLTLIQALNIVVGRFPSVQLLLVGAEADGPYVDQIRTVIAKYGLAGHVSFLGVRRDVASILKSCDVGVLSSASEGLPLALLEYGAAGLPCIATDVGQCAEVLAEGACGVLVPPKSPQHLAAALASLLESARLRAQLGAKAKLRVQQDYSPAAAIRQICFVYESIMRAGYTATESYTHTNPIAEKLPANRFR